MSEHRSAWVAGAGTGITISAGLVHVAEVLSGLWLAAGWLQALSLIAGLAVLAGTALVARETEHLGLPAIAIAGVVMVGLGSILLGLLALVGGTLVYGAGRDAGPTVFHDDRSRASYSFGQD